jgi:hypothetical protein
MLDVSIRLGVLNLLDDLRQGENLATMYVTHDIASARYLADCIVVMYAGQVVESGPATEITDAPAHPYTQLLLSAAPDPSRTVAPVLRGRGAPPSRRTWTRRPGPRWPGRLRPRRPGPPGRLRIRRTRKTHSDRRRTALRWRKATGPTGPEPPPPVPHRGRTARLRRAATRPKWFVDPLEHPHIHSHRPCPSRTGRPDSRSGSLGKCTQCGTPLSKG